MSQAATQSDPLPPRHTGRVPARPFAGVLDLVIVQDSVQFAFPGSISRSHVEAAWVWVYRDTCAELIDPDRLADGSYSAADVEVVMPQILLRMKAGIDIADADPEKDRRLRATLGSLEARDALPGIVLALRSRALLGKAQAFGKAINLMSEDAAIGAALQSMPLKDPGLSALLFHAALPQISNPTRLTTAIIKLCGNATEASLIRMGFSPVIEAILSHAQNQLFALQPIGPFADIDLICRSLDRFHRLARSLTGYIEFARGSRWAMILSAVTKQVSDRIEPRLRDVVADINHSLRKGREGSDRIDNDRVLAAINGVYLLATIRECRDSLALNALFEQSWSQSGEALELHLQRNLDLIRQSPSDANTGARLDAGIKMAEVRFNPEYAETLKRARAAAERRG